MLHQLATANLQTDTRARPPRRKGAGPVPSCSFERSLDSIEDVVCSEADRRRGVRARRLRDFTGATNVRSSVRCKTKVLIPMRAQKKPSSLRSTPRVDDGGDPPETHKKKKMSNDDRACASFFCRGARPRDDDPLSSYTVVRRRGVCVWISVKISPLPLLSFFTHNKYKGRF